MPKIGKVPSCSGAMNRYARSLPNQYAMQLHLLLLRTIASPFESSHYISQKNLQFLCLPRKMNSYTIGTRSHPTTRRSSQSPNGISVSSHEQVQLLIFVSCQCFICWSVVIVRTATSFMLSLNFSSFLSWVL